MALHMAIGFLFLGGGRYTLSTSASAIAVLVCALYPRFPIHTGDNRYHLQAFRHLYVLAIEPRCIEARDVDTGMPCYVSLRPGIWEEWMHTNWFLFLFFVFCFLFFVFCFLFLYLHL